MFPVRSGQRQPMRFAGLLLLVLMTLLAFGLHGRPAAADDTATAITTTTDPPQPPVPPINQRGDKTCVITADIYIMVDSSNSIAPEDWLRELDIVSQIAFRYVPGGSRLAVVAIGSPSPFPLAIPTSADIGFIALRLSQMRAEQAFGSTDLDAGLRAVEQEIINNGAGRPPVIIAFSDFYYTSGDDPTATAQRLRSTYNASLYGVIVGAEPNLALADILTGPPAGLVEAFPYYTRAENWGAFVDTGLAELRTFLCPPTDEHALLVSPRVGQSLRAGPTTIEWTRLSTRVCVSSYTVLVIPYPSQDENPIFVRTVRDPQTSVIWDNVPSGSRSYIIRIITNFCNGVPQPFDWVIFTCDCPAPVARNLDLALRLSADPMQGRSASGLNLTPWRLFADVANVGQLDATNATVRITIRGNRTDPRLAGPIRSDATSFFATMSGAQKIDGPGVCTAQDTSQSASAPYVPQITVTCTGINLRVGETARLTFRLFFPVDAQYNQMISSGAVSHPQDTNPGNDQGGPVTVEIQR